MLAGVCYRNDLLSMDKTINLWLPMYEKIFSFFLLKKIKDLHIHRLCDL